VILKNLLDHFELDDRIGIGTHSSVGEKVNDVFATAEATIEEILAFAITKQPACNDDFGKFSREYVLCVFDDNRDLSHSEWFAYAGTVEDDLIHRIGSQERRFLFAQHPSDSVNDIGFATTIWTDDCCKAITELENCSISEGFEAVKFNAR
jgi:hypothetical protein